MITDSISAFATGTYTVTRPTIPTVVAGRAVAGTPSTFTIDASIQPVQDGRKLLALVEAYHCAEVRLVLTRTVIEPLTPSHGADVVTYQSEPWVVIEAERWDAFGTSWTRAYIARRSTP